MTVELIKITDYCWEIPKTGDMNVPGRIYTSPALANKMRQEEALSQVAHVACLPGIVNASMAMPDMHWGYGFPIGGVAAFDWQSGIISPGGVGYDINCGVRLASTALTRTDVGPKLEALADALYRNIPSGVGSTGSIKLTVKEEKEVLQQGSRWVVNRGMGTDSDIRHTEDEGCMRQADPDMVSDRALERGRRQLGTLGSGNHFLEVGRVSKIYDATVAEKLGLFEGQVTLMLHSGSRGFGYQVCDDSLAFMARHVGRLGLKLPDRQLAYAWIQSQEGQRYYGAMACAANYAWANRQVLMYRAFEVFLRVFGISPAVLQLNLVYDVCHNIAKKEEHMIDNQKQKVCVHRKGATRSFAPGHPAICEDYRSVGQPVIIPGDMGTASYVLTGTLKAMDETFGSTCHGAGRVLSRKAAKRQSRGRSIHREMQAKGIFVRWSGRSILAEEMPDAYKDISQVVAAVHGAGISKKVAKLKPMVVIKG